MELNTMHSQRFNNIAIIRDTYKDLLKYYYKKGVGSVSDVTGIIITDRLVGAIERRYQQLGGNPVLLRIKVEQSDYVPNITYSSNGYFDC